MVAVAEGRTSPLSWLSLSARGIEGLVEKALSLAEAQQLPPAIAIMEDLVIADRASALLPFLLGTMYATAGESRRATSAYAEALLRDDRDGPSAAFRAEVHYLRAREWLRLGALASAHEDLEVAAAANGPVRDQAQLLLTRIREEAPA